LYPYFDGLLRKLGTSIIFWKKVDQLGTQIFYPRIEQKFKDCTIQQSAACKGKQNTSCL
jgi:hypothetical protein